MEGRGNETGRIYGDKPIGVLRHVTRSCGRPQQLPSCYGQTNPLDFRRTQSPFFVPYQGLTRREPNDPHSRVTAMHRRGRKAANRDL